MGLVRSVRCANKSKAALTKTLSGLRRSWYFVWMYSVRILARKSPRHAVSARTNPSEHLATITSVTPYMALSSLVFMMEFNFRLSFRLNGTYLPRRPNRIAYSAAIPPRTSNARSET